MHEGQILAVGDPAGILLESNLSQAYGIKIGLYSSHHKDSWKSVTYCAPVEERD